ncbi:hypothetical protein G7046_g556 [Stylonectria norvegica]|nr:hypothetical protein G7046_g556 [Stylonectria norvegica]
MPILEGFSGNPFRTRLDLALGGLSLLRPLCRYKSAGGARIRISAATGTGFSEEAAQLEGFARPLWLIAGFCSLPSRTSQESAELSAIGLDSWITGLKQGTDPNLPEYWGDLGDFDQRMVEMESLAYAILIAPDTFAFPDDETARTNLKNWLMQINGKKMPENNWRWFRVFVNAALTKVLGVPIEQVQDSIQSDLDILDTFYLGNGWSSDGLWGDERKQVDYYSGSFAIQFAQLLFVKLFPEFDRERTQRYKEQAKAFAGGFWRYFSSNGAAIPFGRSMTYRFAAAAFWAASAHAEVQLPAPLDSPGAVKGMLLRHIRWWSRKPDIFNVDGTLNIGYGYPNMYMAEDYNSPQSVYWCLKAFIVIGLPEDHSFWKSNEMSHPTELFPHLPDFALLREPRHIVCNSPEHHFLLSLGQATRKNHKGREAKYGKFAYSSAFGFSVPVGLLLEHVVPDSTLALSWDSGDSWKVNSNPTHLEFGHMQLGGDTVPTLSGVWKPDKFIDLTIRTTLVPPVRKFPGWHLRFHEVRYSLDFVAREKRRLLQCVDGGFSVSAQTSRGSCIYEQRRGETSERGKEGWWQDAHTAMVVSESGASGVIDLTPNFPNHHRATSQRDKHAGGLIIKPHANTNLLLQRTLLPTVSHTLSFMDLLQYQDADDTSKGMYSFVTGVFAVEGSAEGPLSDELWNSWYSPPSLNFGERRSIG